MVSFSVLIVAEGSEERLTKCLNSLPVHLENWELILHSNGHALSSEFVSSFQEKIPNLILIEAASRSKGEALNAALGSATGDWIYFLHSEAYALQGYWDLIIPLLQDSKIHILGGPEIPSPYMDSLSLSLGMARTSPFCTGPSYARHRAAGGKLQFADDEKLSGVNLWVRRTILPEAPFPEDYLYSEDLLLLQNLKLSGVGMFYHPKLKVGRFREVHIRELWSPLIYAGFYRSKIMRLGIKKDQALFWLPAVFVLSHLVVLVEPGIFLYMVRMYLSIVLFVSLALSMRVKKITLFPLIAFFHYFVISLYGIGFLIERFSKAKESP